MIKINHQNKNIFIKHMLFWIAFIFYELLVICALRGKIEHLNRYMLFYIAYISVFYLNVFILEKLFSKLRNRYFLVFLSIVLELLICLGISFFIDFVYRTNLQSLLNSTIYSNSYIVSHLLRALYFIGLSCGFWLILNNLAIKKQNHEIEKSQLLLLQEKIQLELSLKQTENAFLRQQVNPHLLFNSLNFVHNSSPIDSPTSQGILLLSDIMRYSLDTTSAENKSYLNDEIDQVKNMVELNKLLIGEEMNLKVTLLNQRSNLKIIPLILLTLTENLFKHGNLKSVKSENSLNIFLEGNVLNYQSLNFKKAATNNKTNKKSLGIKNAIERLNYTYKENYKLDIKDNPDTFEINLILPL